MKKRILTGLLVLAMALGLTGGALASTGTVNKALHFGNITVSLDGKPVELVNEKGEKVEPFAMENSTYLPIRAVSKALGLYVDWDSANSTVVLSRTPIAERSNELTLYIVRHGKTMFNTSGQFQGFCDSPLTETGISQAINVGKNMADIPFVGAYSSDLGRQRSTAKLILEQSNHPTPVLGELYGLREWNYGGFEGQSEAVFSDIMAEYGYKPEQYNDFVKKLGNKGLADLYAAKDTAGLAENYEAVSKRAREAMDAIVKECLARGGGNVLVVSSGGQIPTILELISPETFHGEAISNCGVTVVKYADGKYAIDRINDLSYRDGK